MSQKVSYRLLAVLAVFAILLAGCSGGGNKLIGKWEYKEPTSGMTVNLEVTKDKLTFSSLGQSLMEVGYTYVDKDTIKVKDPDTGEEQETGYTLNGDTLTIDFGGTQINFTKVK